MKIAVFREQPLCTTNMGIKAGHRNVNQENKAKQEFVPISIANLKANFLIKSAKISFGRKLEDHFNCGATVLDNGKISFKVWAPYAKEVKVFVRENNNSTAIKDHTKNEIKQILEKAGIGEGSKFKQEDILNNPWHYLLGKAEKSKVLELQSIGGGFFELITDRVNPGELYKFVLSTHDNKELHLKDPRSKSQPYDIHGWSQVQDEKYKWKYNDFWIKHPNKLRHAGPLDSLKAPSKMVVNEIHIGTFTEKGDFEAAMHKLEEIAKDGICNTVEIMPVNEFYGNRNWGYDGTDLFAPESSYGGPKALKALVDKAHSLGLNVLLDVVYNHIGPFYNVLGQYGQYFDQNKRSPWGAALNFENGESGKRVREFMIDNSLHWLKNYNFDGLRFDMTQFCMSDVLLKEIAFEVRKHKPESILVAEDGRNNRRLVYPIKNEDFKTQDAGESFDADSILSSRGVNNRKLKNLGFDSQWNFDFQHTIEALVTHNKINQFGPSVTDLAKEMMEHYTWHDGFDLDLKIPPGHTSVNYAMSHDESGNRGGTRLISKILQDRLGLLHHFKQKGYADNQIEQKAAEATLLYTKAYISKDTGLWKKLNDNYGLNLKMEDFKARFKESKDLNKVAIGAVFVSPGAKMFLMGDEYGEMAPFKFFSQYPVKGLEERISSPADKGYSIGVQAFEESKIGRKNYNNPEIKTFIKDLSKIFYENSALNNGKIPENPPIAHSETRVIAIHRSEQGNEIVAVLNFGEKAYNGNYSIQMPSGQWKEILNSNKNDYGGDNTLINTIIEGYGFKEDNEKVNISLPRHGMVIFKRIK